MEELLINYNYLLAFRNRETLQTMQDPERLSLLAEILRAGPMDRNWYAICEMIASWPKGPAKEKAIDFLDERLSSWDDKIRKVNTAWKFLYEDGMVSEVGRIVRSAEISGREELGDKELLAITRSPNLQWLHFLGISASGIASDGIQSLTGSPYMKNLAGISLTGLTLTEEETRLLFSTANFPKLVSLKLSDLGITTKRLVWLLNSTLITHLLHLDLSYNFLDDEAAELIASSPRLSTLRTLSLRGNHIRQAGAASLANSGFPDRLSELDISENRFNTDVR